jgi:ATP-binding cassette subfamily B protein
MIFGKHLTKYYKQNFHLFLTGIIALIVIDYFQLEIPRQMKYLIDGLTDETLTVQGVYSICLTILGFALIIVTGRLVWRFTIFGASRRFDYGLRNDMFLHCEELSVSYYNDNKTGALMAHYTNDLDAVRMAVGPGMVMFVDATFMGILTVIRMLQVNTQLAILSALPLALITVISGVLGTRMRRKFKEAQKAFEEMTDYVTENLSGISVIKAFVKEKIEVLEFMKRNAKTKNKNFQYIILDSILNVTVRTIIMGIFILIIGLGGFIVYEGYMTGGDLVYFYSLFGSLVWPMMAVARIVSLRSRGKASLERISTILDQEVEVKDSVDVLDIEEIKGRIEFKNLNFMYPDANENVLSNISFTINQGEMVGILGRTGSGKTSIVDLLLRLYNIEEGSLYLDGIDIMNLPIDVVREGIGYVPQDGFLFSDTITNNIGLRFGRREELYQEITQAAMLSDVHSNIEEFSEGYNTVIGERGVTLSGGQRQRISIARALIKNPPIIILDDSVSAVDTKTEETILSNLKEIRNNKTTIMIAHRISTIKNADKIIIVDDGKILDVGTHEELLTRCDFYVDMVQRQQLEDEVEVA